MLASWMILAVGVWDDLREISWKTQLFYQTAAAVLIFIFGIRIFGIRNPLSGGVISLEEGIGIAVAFFISILWIIVIINSMNWLDGIDGLSGGIFFICSIAMFVLSLRPEVNQPPVAILAMILAGSALGFLFFNFYPSVIMAGTSGSMFMGFILATLAIFAGTKVATAILVLSLPIIDFIWVIGERLRHKRSIFEADKNHLHHKLLELGWSQRKITLGYYGITAIVTFIALNTRVVGKSIAFVLILAIVASTLFFINKKLARA
jgi:UDP-GlcNAc:undecaprenyl-phosphate/decaprenyl-phosphate GlcNAc-1-phosphate transferase